MIRETEQFEDHAYEDGVHIWKVKDLIEFAKKEGYKVFDMPLAGIVLDNCPFEKQMNLKEAIEHAKRTKRADLKYPILLDTFGRVCDGNHRVIKAFLLGRKFIKAVRMEEMPSNYEIKPHESVI